MEEIENSTTVKDYINSITCLEPTPETEKSLTELAREIGACIGRLHREHIIHGDLTTSNMMVVRKDKCFGKLYFIDFGLSHVAQTPEDKGVDLYVLERAILSTHPNSQKLFEDILVSYMSTYKSGGKEVSKKFEEVRARGRKRTMVG
jgi:TP53 regulating kinase-like protein